MLTGTVVGGNVADRLCSITSDLRSHNLANEQYEQSHQAYNHNFNQGSVSCNVASFSGIPMVI